MARPITTATATSQSNFLHLELAAVAAESVMVFDSAQPFYFLLHGQKLRRAAEAVLMASGVSKSPNCCSVSLLPEKESATIKFLATDMHQPCKMDPHAMRSFIQICF